MGHVTYSQLTLRRGMTANFDLWRWFERVASRDGGGVRATAEVAITPPMERSRPALL